jgi:hypothetical protein
MRKKISASRPAGPMKGEIISMEKQRLIIKEAEWRTQEII